MQPLSREADLLLTAIRPAFNEAAAARLRALIQSGLDWDFLNQLATRHRLSPIVYRRIDATAPNDVPRPVFMEMWRQYEINARRNEVMLDEMLQAVDRITASGIPVVAYKGPILALQLYNDVALREFEDLDLLVDAANATAVSDLLKKNGYDAHDAMTPGAEASFRGTAMHYHLGFVHRDHRTKLELHWKTDPEFPVERISEPSWWRSLDRVEIAGRQVLTFNRTDLLTLLCLHGTKHQGHRLGWIADIAALIRSSTIEWSSLTDFAARRRCRRRVLVTLELAKQLVGVDLPEEVVDAVHLDPKIARIAGEMIGRLFTNDVNELEGIDRLPLSLRLYDRAPQRVRHVWQTAFSPTMNELSGRAVPAGFEFLYVPLRMLRLIGKYGSIAIGRAAKR
jgi:hypothetical protein